VRETRRLRAAGLPVSGPCMTFAMRRKARESHGALEVTTTSSMYV